MIGALRLVFHVIVVRPFVLGVLGLDIRHRERLPATGPAIVVANHNNHVDTMVLTTLFPLLPFRRLLGVRAAAAADYFLRNRVLAWIAVNLFAIIPIKRGDFLRRDGDPLADCSAALERGDILIFYPEGTRGEPERMSQFRSGVAHLARAHPHVPVIPVFLFGLGRFMPRGAFLPVPFQCSALIGEPVRWQGDRERFMQFLHRRMADLAREGNFPGWA